MHIGRYEVELQLGEGGIGRVFLARDPAFGRQVALKVLRDDLGLTPEQRKALGDRVREETRAAATLSHPVLVSLYDLGDDDRAGLYIVAELVRGPTLRERLHEGPLPTGEVAQLARALGAVLTHAHVAGLVHRGVRPDNVMLAPTGCKLTDFGISPPDLRSAGYSAPEVVAGGGSTAMSDQFSLAATLYEAITGQRAFPGSDPETVAARVVDADVASPRKALPSLRGFLRLDRVFVQGLAKDPKKRFASCEALGAALATELEGPRVTFLATPGPDRSSQTRATRRWQNVLAVIAVGVIVALLAFGRFQPSGNPATGTTLKGAAGAFAEERLGRRTADRSEATDGKPVSSKPGPHWTDLGTQRVVPAPPFPSALPSSSATSSGAPSTAAPSSS